MGGDGEGSLNGGGSARWPKRWAGMSGRVGGRWGTGGDYQSTATPIPYGRGS